MSSVLAGLALMQAASGAPTPEELKGQPILSCASPMHAAFDFWVGEWDVFHAGSEEKVADSTIERTHGGCAVIENWKPLNGRGGTSLNHFDANTGEWHQKWMGTGPHAVEFTGGPTVSGMVITGYWRDYVGQGRSAWVRMTYSRNEDGSVRQFGEASVDYGVTWNASFDLLYRPKATDTD
ncbi:MAG: hypothetical protein AAGK02_04410 [Pseudomonadota bacterium]